MVPDPRRRGTAAVEKAIAGREPRDHARPAARAVGPYPSDSGASAGSGRRGVQALAASDDAVGVWERISELFKALVDAPSSSPAHSAAQSELGDRLWRMLRDMLWPALTAQSPHSAGLLSLLRSLAATRARLPELARLALEILRRAQTEEACGGLERRKDECGGVFEGLSEG